MPSSSPIHPIHSIREQGEEDHTPQDLSDSTEFITVLSPSQPSEEKDDFLLESIIEHPDRPLPTTTTTTTINLLPHHLLLNTTQLLDHHSSSSSSPSAHPSHPPLDLSCVNSDETDASINSLFSFPDPLQSVDPIHRITQSDCPHQDWYGQCQPSPTEFVPSLSSDYQSNFSSDHLDFRSSSSPSLNDTDLPSPRSLSSLNSPFIRTAGSALSHRLVVHICGHPLPESRYHQISFHLRLNFTQIHSLNSDYPPSPQYPVGSRWSWPLFSRTRFRMAISRVLSNSAFATDSPNETSDLMHQTSWLEIVLNDLTFLSPEDQFSFLSAGLPAHPALLIYAASSSHCFSTKWLKELTKACPAQIHLFKVLPILIDEKKYFFQNIFRVVRQHLDPPANTKWPVIDSEFFTSESVFPGLLLQDPLDSMDHHILRPSELSLLSTSSVTKLHQLLVPFKPSVKTAARCEPRTCSKIYAIVFGGLIAILASIFLFRFQLLGFQSFTQPLMGVIGSSSLSPTVKQVNITLDDFGMPPISNADSTHSTHCTTGNADPIHHPQALMPNKAYVTNCRPVEMNALNQVLDPVESHTRIETAAKPRGEKISYSDEDAGDRSASSTDYSQLIPKVEPQPKSPLLTRTSSCSLKTNLSGLVCTLEDYYHNSNFKDDLNSIFLFKRLNYEVLKIWSSHLPKRLKKSLQNVKNHPDLCIKKIRSNF